MLYQWPPHSHVHPGLRSSSLGLHVQDSDDFNALDSVNDQPRQPESPSSLSDKVSSVSASKRRRYPWECQANYYQEHKCPSRFVGERDARTHAQLFHRDLGPQRPLCQCARKRLTRLLSCRLFGCTWFFADTNIESIERARLIKTWKFGAKYRVPRFFDPPSSLRLIIFFVHCRRSSGSPPIRWMRSSDFWLLAYLSKSTATQLTSALGRPVQMRDVIVAHVPTAGTPHLDDVRRLDAASLLGDHEHAAKANVKRFTPDIVSSLASGSGIICIVPMVLIV
jgi:hypothetical protein